MSKPKPDSLATSQRTDEGRAFWSLMAKPDSREDRERPRSLTVGAFALRLMRWVSIGVIVPPVDAKALVRLCDVVDIAVVEGELLPSIEPRIDVDHPNEFDRLVVSAGLKMFVRPSHRTESWSNGRMVHVRELPAGRLRRSGLGLDTPPPSR